ncbi:HAD family hydrolase [Corynebacterium minutissimum]
MPFVERIRRASGVIFDFNGTLSDDEAVLEKSYSLALEDLDLKPLKSGEYESLLGLSEVDISRSLVQDRGASCDVEELLEALAARYTALSHGAELITTSTVDLVKTLQCEGKKVGIVTGTLRSLLEPVLKENGLDSLLPNSVTIEDVTAGKPDPQGFLLGAKHLKVSPESVVVFEDSVAGVTAARRAQMCTVAVGTNTAAAAIADFAFDSMGKAAEQYLCAG